MDMIIFDVSLISFVALVIALMVSPERNKTATTVMTKVTAAAAAS